MTSSPRCNVDRAKSVDFTFQTTHSFVDTRSNFDHLSSLPTTEGKKTVIVDSNGANPLRSKLSELWGSGNITYEIIPHVDVDVISAVAS